MSSVMLKVLPLCQVSCWQPMSLMLSLVGCITVPARPGACDASIFTLILQCMAPHSFRAIASYFCKCNLCSAFCGFSARKLCWTACCCSEVGYNEDIHLNDSITPRPCANLRKGYKVSFFLPTRLHLRLLIFSSSKAKFTSIIM